MPVAAQILKNFALFVDGKGYAGQVENFKPPKLEILEEDFRAGGMDAPIGVEMGMAKLETEFNLLGYVPDVLALWGVGPNNVIQFVGRGAVENLDGTVEPVNITVNGMIRIIEPDQWEGGKKSGLKLTLSLRSYTYTQNGTVIHDIDIINFKRVINGVDRLAAQRAALGL